MDTLELHYRKIVIVLVVIILSGSGLWMLRHRQPGLFLGTPDFVVDEADVSSEPEPTPTERKHIVLHVAGAVNTPGVYQLAEGARIADAIRIAGGATENAALHRLNLAAKLNDGQQVVVPELGEASPMLTEAPSAPTPQANPSKIADSSGLIDINTATSEQLQTLPRIGPVMAERIIEYRQAHDRFTSVDELRNVKGVGAKTLEGIRSRVVVR